MRQHRFAEIEVVVDVVEFAVLQEQAPAAEFSAGAGKDALGAFFRNRDVGGDGIPL